MKQKKRLLVYATQMLETGGIESHLKEFIKNIFQTNDCLIDFVVAYSEMNANQINELKKYCNKLFLGKQKRDTPQNLLALGFRYALTKYDCLYTNGQGNSIILVSKCFRFKKWVHHHHTAGDSLDQKEWSSWYIKAMLKANKVIACSKTNATDISFALKRNIDVIYCFSRKVNNNLLSHNKMNQKNKISLGYFGRLIPEKGIDLITKLSSDKDCDTISFHIWGRGDAYPDSYFENYPNLNYHGSFEGLEGLQNVVATLDGFLLLSTHPEGLPVCLLEVMGGGLPWLATPKGGIKDIVIDEYNTEICNPELEYEQVKHSILLFKENIEKGNTNSSKLIDYYDQTFAQNILIKAWLTTLFNLNSQ